MYSWFFMAPALVIVYMTISFIIAQYLHDNSIADIGWGLGFVLLAVISYYYAPLFTMRSALTTICICIWGLRLSWHILLRHKGEDFRYRQWRESWGKYGVIKAFFYVFMLQGLLMLIIASPVLVINTALIDVPLSVFDYGVFVLWIVGYLFEAIGDYQLTEFLSQSENRGKICTFGLWRFTRHPNYFGEICMWTSLFLFALPLPNGWYTIISPLTIINLFIWISIPQVENPFRDNLEYQQYKKETNCLIPFIY
jgi:steroid 5-alpha reductase family enzyme